MYIFNFQSSHFVKIGDIFFRNQFLVFSSMGWLYRIWSVAKPFKRMKNDAEKQMLKCCFWVYHHQGSSLMPFTESKTMSMVLHIRSWKFVYVGIMLLFLFFQCIFGGILHFVRQGSILVLILEPQLVVNSSLWETFEQSTSQNIKNKSFKSEL